MSRPSWLEISLARKISLLFGLAVLLTILVTLRVPSMQMEYLSQKGMLESAKRVASVADVEASPIGDDWTAAQDDLTRRWDFLAETHELPPLVPLLVRMPAVLPDFLEEAKRFFLNNPTENYFPPENRGDPVARLAMAFHQDTDGPRDEVSLLAMIEVAPTQQPTGPAPTLAFKDAKEAVDRSLEFLLPKRREWPYLQDELRKAWPSLALEHRLSVEVPRVVRAKDPGGFLRDAEIAFQDDPERIFFYHPQDEGATYRLAKAIRDKFSLTNPTRLRGVIDVRLPIGWASQAWNAVITVLAGASGAVLAILTFYIVTNRVVLQQVHELRSVAEQVTTGDLEVRAEIQSGDEFEDLASSINDMLTHLNTAQNELRTSNKSLDVKIHELAQSNVDLYEANRIKTEFLSNVSHELRTPLVSIIGFAELLHESWGSVEPNQVRLARFAENILTSGRGLLDIINDLLDIAKIEAGKMDLHLSNVLLADLCSQLIDLVRPLADKRNQELTLSVTSDLPKMVSDPGKIKQILYNLLSNAIKFTPPEGSVTLSVARQGDDMVRLEVSDTGPGIPLEQRHAIFDQFHQLDSSSTREYEGTGLGLAITKQLTEILQGSITLVSADGGGATFIVELKADLKPLEAHEPSPDTKA